MRSFLIFSLLTLFAFAADAQGRRYRYVGLQSGCEVPVVDPYYPIESFRINVVPLVFQTPINRVLDFKLNTLGFLDFANQPSFNSAGFNMTIPRWFGAKERFSEKSRGWYLGPSLGATRMFDENFYSLRSGLEFGRYFQSAGAFSFSFNLQTGISRNVYVNEHPTWTPFVGINLGVGFWAKQEVNVRGGAM